MGGRVLDDLVITYPQDLLAVIVGHQIDFFTGDAVSLRVKRGETLGKLDHRRVRGAARRGRERVQPPLGVAGLGRGTG